jgi:hypothetical protein
MKSYPMSIVVSFMTVAKKIAIKRPIVMNAQKSELRYCPFASENPLFH